MEFFLKFKPVMKEIAISSVTHAHCAKIVVFSDRMSAYHQLNVVTLSGRGESWAGVFSSKVVPSPFQSWVGVFLLRSSPPHPPEDPLVAVPHPPASHSNNSVTVWLISINTIRSLHFRFVCVVAVNALRDEQRLVGSPETR